MKPNDWERLCRNSAAMHIILVHSGNINYSALSFLTKDYNKYVLGHLMANSAAMDIITKDMSSINYEFLSKNTNAMHLLEDKFINVKNLLANSSIFSEC